MDKRDRLDGLATATTVGLCALWAISHVAVKLANEGVSPAFQSGLRSLGALACLLVWSQLRGIKLFERDGTLIAGVLAGTMFAAEFALIFWALTYTDVARGVIIGRAPASCAERAAQSAAFPPPTMMTSYQEEAT